MPFFRGLPLLRWLQRRFLLGLRVRLLLLILFAITPAAALLIYNAAEQRRYDTAEVQESALRLARNSALSLNGLFEEAHQFLETLAQLPVVREPAQHSTCSQVFARLRTIHPRYANFGAALPNGDVVCSAAPLKSRVNIADRPYFKRALATRDFTMSGLQTGRIIGKLAINFGHPATNARGEVEAIVFTALDLTWLNAMLAATQLPEGGALTVVNSEGTITARHPEPEQWVGKTLPDAPLVRALLDQHGEGGILAAGLDGVRRLYTFTTLSEKHAPGHYVTVGIPESEAFSGANRNMVRGLSFLVVIGLAVAALAWFGSNWLVLRPIQALTAAVRRIGQGDLTARAGLPHTPEEFGQLAHGFDTMAQSLEEREQRLRENEEKLRLFVQHAPSSIAMFDRDMRYIAYSRRWLTDYGLGDQDITGRNHYEIFPNLPDRWKEIHRRCLAGAVEKADEDPSPHADGTMDWVRWEVHPWHADNGQIGWHHYLFRGDHREEARQGENPHAQHRTGAARARLGTRQPRPENPERR